jgi:Uma2 family endonuclease
MQPVLHTNFSFPPPRYTYDDYKNWSDEWELIEGYPYSLMPSAKRKHHDFATNFVWVVRSLLFGKPCNCRVYAELDWIVSSETVVRPNGMIVCGDLEEDYITTPPALIVEISSASTYLKDKNIKYKLYETNGVKYYLMADVEKEKISSFELIEGAYQPKYDAAFQLTPDCEITLSFNDMWKQ